MTTKMVSVAPQTLIGESMQLPPEFIDFTRQISQRSELPTLEFNETAWEPAGNTDTSQGDEAAEHTLPTLPVQSPTKSQHFRKSPNTKFPGLPRSPKTPKAKCCGEELLLKMQRQMLTEMALMNRKLDHLAAHVGLVQPRQGCVVTPTHKGQSDCNPEPGTASIESDKQAKFRRARSKIRVLGAIIAAGKRRGRTYGGDGGVTRGRSRGGEGGVTSEAFKASEDLPVRSPSVATTIKSKTSRLVPVMFDSESAQRLRHIQKALRLQNVRKGLRFKMWQFTQSAYSSRAAFVYAGLSNLIVVISVLTAFLCVSVKASSVGAYWDVLEIVFEVFFGLEFALRLVCCPFYCDFILSFFNLVDLLTILPLFLRLSSLLPMDSAMLSVVPFLRLLKLMRWFEKLQLLTHAFERALEALPSLLYTMAVIALCFAEVLYLVEPSESIGSLPVALWFTIVTMTTVGYGDYTPTTELGHIVASVLIITSALYMAMPLGIVGNAFSEVWGDRDRLLVMKRFRSAFLQGGFTLQGFHDVFAIFDADGNGTLDIDEFALMLRTIQMNLSEDRVSMLFQALDKERSGEIQFEELLAALVPKSFARTKLRFSSVSEILGSWTLNLSPSASGAIENV